MPVIYSIGHSNRSLDDLLDLLTEFKIKLLADVRRFPGSRRCPQFNQDNLSAALREQDIDYAHFEALGGRRRPPRDDSANIGLRNASFRGYADYMTTDEFAAGIDDLLQHADDRPTAMMCAEAVYWRCHRRLISDYLYATRGIEVQHILGPGQLKPHRLTDAARITPAGVDYPPPLWNRETQPVVEPRINTDEPDKSP